MKTDDLYQFFGSAKNIVSALGIKRITFYSWVSRGFIPFKQQKNIELLTKGKLKAIKKDSNKFDEEMDLDKIYLPIFRYYDKKNGMCEVKSINFNPKKRPKIIYINPNNRKEEFYSFNSETLMQAANIKDINGKVVYEGDILLLKDKKKFFFRNIDSANKLKKLGKFKIIGNIFE